MPTVGRYQGQRVVSQVAPLGRAPRAPAAAFGQSIAQGAANLAAGVGEMQQRFAETEAREALTDFERQKNKMFFDPDSGYFNTAGRDAFEGAEAVRTQLSELKRSYKFKSPEAQQAFDRASEAQITLSDLDIMRHSSKQMQAWEAGAIQAGIENSIESAALYSNDPERLEVHREIGRQGVIDAAENAGQSAEELNENLQNFESSFNSSAVRSAARKSYQQGEELLERYRNRIEPQDIEKLEGFISRQKEAQEKGNTARSSVFLAGSLMRQYSDLDDGQSQIMEIVDDIKDPELQVATRKEIKARFVIKKEAESQARKNTFETAEKYMMAGGSIVEYRSRDPEGWSRLSPKQQRTLEAGVVAETDYTVLTDLMLLPREELSKVDPNEYMHQLKPEHRVSLSRMVKSAREGGADHQEGRTRAAQTTSALEQFFEKPKRKWNDERKKQADSLYAILDARVRAEEQDKGAPITSAEYTDLLNDTMRKWVVDVPFWFDREEDLTEVPAEAADEIVQFLRNSGQPVTPANIKWVNDQRAQLSE